MTNFDSKFLELQTKVAAVLQMLITEYPDAAAKAKAIINDYATYQAEQETIQAYVGGQSHTNANHFIGWMSDVRITNGYARYTTTFTPPTSLLPDVPVVRLPTAVANTNRYTVNVEGAQTVLIGPTAGQTINGSATALAVAQNDSHDLISNGSNWRLV